MQKFNPACRLFSLAFLLIWVTPVLEHKTWAQQSQMGIFTDHANIGNVKKAGSVVFNPVNGTYKVSGGGENIYNKEDQFHFVYKKMTGDFTLRCRCNFVVGGGDRFRKIGWMIRKDLSNNSAYVDIAIHGRGLAALQWRREKGEKTNQIQSGLKAPDVIQLERKGTNYTMSLAKFGKPFVVSTLEKIALGDDVYVGLFVCAHDKNEVEKAIFNNVRVIRSASEKVVGRLEVMDVDTGRRVVVHETTDKLMSPIWATNGKALIFREGSRLNAIGLKTKNINELESDLEKELTGDHVLSPDGKQIGFTHLSADHNGGAAIYTMPLSGGEPKLVSKLVPSYVHAWSPDGESLLFTGLRDKKYDVFKIAAAGGEEVRLTDSEGVNDGAEFSHDGEHIFFNSNRSGDMEIWRMNTDGTEQTQITDDKFHNWFPHASPDGKSIVYLSYTKGGDSAAHQMYKPVYIRQLFFAGGKPKVIAFLNGGLGSINVNSWSPDGRKIAFVSYSGVE